MHRINAIIVGAGPAGAACAWALRRRGVECLLLDREKFPRLKLCGGLLTPEALDDLEFDVGDYPHSHFTIERFCFHYRNRQLTLKSPQHSIRRVEFDDWLMTRSGVGLHRHYVRSIVRDGDYFVIDDAYRCRYLIGAGGTRCPVYRSFFRDLAPRDPELQISVLEEEFPYNWTDDACHFWFFEDGIAGYYWYIPKAGGHLNIGVGSLTSSLNRRQDSIRRHWDQFTELLNREGLVCGHNWNPGGYTFYLRGRAQSLRNGNAFVAGDAAGFATRDLGEGIRPAIETGLRVATAIGGAGKYDLRGVPRYSAGSLLKSAWRHWRGASI